MTFVCTGEFRQNTFDGAFSVLVLIITNGEIRYDFSLFFFFVLSFFRFLILWTSFASASIFYNFLLNF